MLFSLPPSTTCSASDPPQGEEDEEEEEAEEYEERENEDDGQQTPHRCRPPNHSIEDEAKMVSWIIQELPYPYMTLEEIFKFCRVNGLNIAPKQVSGYIFTIF